MHIEAVFPDHTDGMDVPLRWSVDIAADGDGWRLDAELAGGVPEKTYPHPGNYHGRVLDWVTRPYLRLDGTDGSTGNLYLADRTLVLCAPPVPNELFYGQLYAEPEWPCRGSFRVDRLPAGAELVVGYEHYCCEVALARQGGPTEMRLDPATGAVRRIDRVPRPGEPLVRFTSPPSPGLLARLPATDPRHDAAAAYVANNHYFIAGEPCVFTVSAVFPGNVEVAESRFLCRLEDACLRPLTDYRPCPPTPAPDPPPGTRAVAGKFVVDAPLAVGVYHLRARLDAASWVGEACCAFEVMPASPAAPAAPRASGLPVLFSMPNEIRGLETDTFDPWQGVSDDPAHYISIACFYPDFGGDQRVADTLHAYGREWFAWITTRTTDRPDWEDHRGVVASCDYLNSERETGPLPTNRWWLARPWCYTGIVLAVLRQFVQDTDRDLVIPPDDNLPMAVFETLLATCWHEWLAYANHYFRTHFRAPYWAAVQGVNPAVRGAGYGPYQAYVGHYKGTHHLNHYGYTDAASVAARRSGFMVFEDYPWACRYPIARGVYELAACKLAMPAATIYPELYGRSLEGCPDGAVFHAWPPAGVFDPPVNVVRKRILEYVFAAVWFAGGTFHYWRDYGFHVRNWEAARYEPLLRAWGTVLDHPPARPLRTTGFVGSEACCRAAGSRLPDDPLPAVFNTTEEAPNWAGELARLDGQAAGFVTRIEELADLHPEDVDTLVLPPLFAVTEAQRTAIRGLHEAGVNLLAFEAVPGLEDLFGVVAEPVPPPPVRSIRVNTGLADNPLAALADLVEQTDTVDTPPRYRAAGARVLLTGDAPVLFEHRTAWGRTALYNLAPTMVRRDTRIDTFRDGASSCSELINRSVQLLLRSFSAAPVTTTSGKLIACRTRAGAVLIVVEEDGFPGASRPIAPEVTIRLPGLRREDVAGDRPFTIVALSPASLTVRIPLAEDDCAVLIIGGQSGRTIS